MTNEACTAQACGFDPQSMWLVQPTSARISGNSWDLATPPDPYVDLYCPATETSPTDSTPSVTDSSNPTWSSGGCVMTAAQLLSAGFAFAVYDEDGVSADDRIASKTTVMVTAADLMAGTLMRGPMSSLTSITFTFSRM